MKNPLLLLALSLTLIGCTAPKVQEQYAQNYLCVPQPKRDQTVCYPLHGAMASMEAYKGGVLIGAIVPHQQAMLISGQHKKLDINIGETFGWRIVDLPKPGENK